LRRCEQGAEQALTVSVLVWMFVLASCAAGPDIADETFKGAVPPDADAGSTVDAGPLDDPPDAQDEPAPLPIRLGYWRGVRRKLAVSPNGNPVAVSCHNCYRDDLTTSTANLEATLREIHAGQDLGADLIEIDVREHQGTWYVGHDDDGSQDGAPLREVLADAALREGDQLLYLEIKERAPTEDSLAELLAIVAKADIATPGRFAVLRSFNDIAENLAIVRRQLEAMTSRALRVQVLFATAEVDDLSAAPDLLEAALRNGFDGVEFNHRSRHILELLAMARAAGLGTNVWTFGAKEGSAKCEQFRDVTDAVTTDSAPDACRSAISLGQPM
jgi:hypothetical protein